MKQKLLFFVLSLAAIAAFLGCRAGGSAPFATKNGETVVSPEIRIVDDKGRFDDIRFPSGVIIKCPNEKTFQEGVKVTAAEQKIPVITDNSGKFSYIYVYNISAVLPSDNSLTADVPVNTIEKPLKVSFTNNSTTGYCYIGTRASESDPWLYTLADDGGVGNQRYSRFSISSPKVCYFDIYRLNIQFRLFVFDNEDSDKAEVDFVNVSTGSKENKITIEKGKYTEDLEIKISLYGEKLDSLNVDNLAARIIYRSKNLSPVQLKANGSIVKQNDSDDKAVTGGYEHSFEINNIKIDSSMSGETVLSFVLNLNGISLEDFPTDFLVEFYSDTKDEKAIPFIYTRAFSFETEEKQEEPEPKPQLDTYTITLDPNGGTLDNTTIEYTAETDDFNLPTPTKTGYTFLGWTGTGLDNATTQVTIEKGSTGNRTYTANWQQNAPDEYTLTLVAGTGIASVDDSKAYQANKSIDLNYTLKDGYEFDKWSDSNGNEVASPFTMPAEDVALTANAKAIIYNITYNLDKGQTTKDNPENYTVETEITLTNPTKTGYTFKGWSGTDLDGDSNKEVKIAKGSTGNRTYTANWTKVAFTITYDLKGGTLAEDNPDGYNTASETFKLKEPTKTGYTFIGWTGSNGDTPQTSLTIAQGSTGDRNYTANYSINSYNITINKGIGINTVAGDGQHEYNSSVTATCTMLAGYDFDSWSGDFTTATFNMPANNATMTANAKVITYNLTYNGIDNCTFTNANPTTYTVENADITLNAPKKEGYKFIGWTYEGQTTPNEIVTIDKGSIGAKEYTANWNKLLTITIASNTGSVFEPVVNNLYKFSPSFTIIPTVADGIILTDEEKANIINAISVKDSNSSALNSISKTWENGKIALSFNQDLSANATYTISCDDIDGMAITCTPLSFLTFCFKGSGTRADPYLVENAAQLNLVRNYLSCCFKQTESIELDGINWLPIGNDTNKFSGYYDGNSKTISKLSISFESTNNENYNNGYIGLFGYNVGTISYLIIDSASININSNKINYIGCLAGYIKGGTIENCKVTNSDICSASDYWVGGICGYLISKGKVTDCNVENTRINFTNYGNVYVGGICGQSYDGTIIRNNVKNTDLIGSTTGYKSTTACVGGICGYLNMSGTISNCSVVKDSGSYKISGFTENTSTYIGGICGLAEGNITYCYVKGYDIEGSNNDANTKYVGGICGSSLNPNNNISKSYVEAIRLSSTGKKVNLGAIGGICGEAFSDFISCYVKDSSISVSDVNNSFYVGGIFGSATKGGCTISSCYFYGGSIDYTGDDNFGLLVGYNRETFKDCFTSLSDNVSLVGTGTAEVTSYGGVNSKTTFEGKTWSDGLDYRNEASFNDANSRWKDFDFTNWPPDLKENRRQTQP